MNPRPPEPFGLRSPSSRVSKEPEDQFRDIKSLLAPLDDMAADSAHLIALHGVQIAGSGEPIRPFPRYLFAGPQSGEKPIRIGLFAGIYGDEPEGVHALLELLNYLEAGPELAAGYMLFVYPICNPDGFTRNRRELPSGNDLEKEFWKNSAEPEVQFLESELRRQSFQGLISLHSDEKSEGFYAAARGATLTKHLIEPALRAAEKLLPRNRATAIGGFKARNGIIRDEREGALSVPPGIRPRPFEITLTAPKALPEYEKQAAFVLALHSILAEYRKFIAYAPNL